MQRNYKLNSFLTPIILSCFLMFCSILSGWCQQITIGQYSHVVKALIEQEVQINNRSKGYNQVSMSCNTDYFNGEISDVIICKENVPMIDLKKSVNFCTIFIMKDKRLSYSLTHYSNISIQELENVMSKDNIRIGNYYFGDDNNYSKVYLSTSGQATKEVRSRLVSPIPTAIQNQLNAIRQKREEDVVFDASKADNYDGFVPMQTKIYYTAWTGKSWENFADKVLIKNASPTTKAILAYYTCVSYAPDISNNLNLGVPCSNHIIKYISNYFNDNKSIINDISECSTRTSLNYSKNYSLDRLELSKVDSFITVSYAMTYFENNSSQDRIVGIDQFSLNNDNTLKVLKLSSKLSAIAEAKILNKKIYDIKETDSNAYESFKLKLKSEFLSTLKKGSNQMPSFDDILNNYGSQNFRPSFAISNNYNINWRTEVIGNPDNDPELIENNSLNKGKDDNYELLKSCRVFMPNIIIDGVYVKQRILTVNNIDVDFERGICFAKVTKGNIEFYKYPPSGDSLEKIKARLKDSSTGTYLIMFEIGNVMGENYENITLQKKTFGDRWQY